jgi:hypothetical protein
VTIHLHNVGPAVVVEVDEPAAPRHIAVIDADSGRVERQLAEGPVAVVVVEIAGVVGEVGLEDIEPPVAIVVGDTQTPMPGLLVAVGSL